MSKVRDVLLRSPVVKFRKPSATKLRNMLVSHSHRFCPRPIKKAQRSLMQSYCSSSRWELHPTINSCFHLRRTKWIKSLVFDVIFRVSLFTITAILFNSHTFKKHRDTGRQWSHIREITGCGFESRPQQNVLQQCIPLYLQASTNVNNNIITSNKAFSLTSSVLIIVPAHSDIRSGC